MKRVRSTFLKVKEGFGVLFFRILGSVSLLLLSLYLARSYGAESAGTIATCIALVNVITTFSRLGLDNFAIKTIPQFLHDGKILEIKYFIGQTLTLIGGAAVLIFFLLQYELQWLVSMFSNNVEAEGVFLVFLIASIPLAITFHLSEILRAKHIYTLSIISQLIFIPITTVVLDLVSEPSSLVHVAGCYLVASLILLVILIYKFRFELSFAQVMFEKLVKVVMSSSNFYAISILTCLMSYLDVLMLSAFSDDKSVGIYNAAVRTAGVVAFILVAFNTILTPKVSQLLAKGDVEEMVKICRKYSAIMALVSVPVFSIIVLNAEFIMSIYGPEFVHGNRLLIITSFGQLVNVLTGPVGNILLMSGNEKLMKYNILFGFIIQMLLIVTLAPEYGALGVAFSFSISLIFMNIISFLLVRIKFGRFIYPSLSN